MRTASIETKKKPATLGFGTQTHTQITRTHTRTHTHTDTHSLSNQPTRRELEKEIGDGGDELPCHSTLPATPIGTLQLSLSAGARKEDGWCGGQSEQARRRHSNQPTAPPVHLGHAAVPHTNREQTTKHTTTKHNQQSNKRPKRPPDPGLVR